MDQTPIVARLSIIADATSALEAMQGLSVEEFVADDLVHTAAEHYLQIAVQAALDIGNIILAELPTRPITSYSDIFPALGKAGILPRELADRLAGLARLRNILVHMYLQVDLRRIYELIQENLGDFVQFAEHVGKYLDGPQKSP